MEKRSIRLFDRTCRCKYLNEENAICKETGKECVSIVGCRDRYKQALEEIKEILKHYSETTLGELQSDGTFRYLLNNNSINGKQYLTYDPRPAKKGLQKINEVVKDE